MNTEPSTSPRCSPAACIYGSHAFSLVEVVIALGLFSFAAVSIMGLMGVGITTTRETIDSSVSSQILQELSGKIFLTPYSRLTTEYFDKTFFYTEDGRPQEAQDSNSIYTLNTSIADAVYPGSTQLDATKSVQVVTVEVIKAPGNDVIRHCNVMVPNSGN